ncbi:MAG: chorismate mutase [Gemmatimonadales bacterium]
MSQETHVYRAIRGATTIAADERALVRDAIDELLRELMKRNALETDDIISAYFTATPDICSDFPARTARDSLGWHDVPMLCAVEMSVPGVTARCLRVMLHAAPSGRKAVHAYLRGAAVLRPDLA